MVASLGSLHGRSLSCGVMDGVDYYVEAAVNGRVVQFDANNPEQCRGEAAKRIKRLLAIMAGDA